MNLISDLFTVSVTSSVGSPSTVAVLVITFVNPSVNSFTVTSKEIVVSPYAGTFTVIPFVKSASPKFSVSGLLLILMLPSTKLVPSGIVSLISTSLLKPPSFVTVIVYVIFSPSTTYPKLFSVVDSFSAEIIDFTYVCVVVSVGLLLTVAVFSIDVPLFWSFTVTLNSTVFVSPASKSTEIPFARSTAELSVSVPPTFMLPCTNVVPAGIVSFTVTVSGAVPLLLSNVIIYVISCPSTTFPFAGFAVLCACTFGLFTVFVVSPVGVPSTVAVFFISFVNVFSFNSSTATSNVTSLLEYGCTFTVIPLLKFPSSSVISLPSIFTLFGTSVVPSGISSVTIISFAYPPSFFTVIVYVIFSPSTTYAKPFSVDDSFSPEIIGFTYVWITGSVSFPSTVATFLISVLSSSSFAITLNSTVFVSPADNSTSIPLARVSSVFSVACPPTFMLPFTKLVPDGISSFTVTVSGAVPLLLSNVIIYVISCPAITLPSAGLAVLCASTFGLFTVFVASPVGSPST